jgi:hypothetical protein
MTNGGSPHDHDPSIVEERLKAPARPKSRQKMSKPAQKPTKPGAAKTRAK